MIGKSENELILPDVNKDLIDSYKVKDSLVVNMILTAKSEQTINLKFDVLDNANLKIVIFDLASHDVNLDIEVNALENTDCNIYVAANSKEEYKKHFNVKVNNLKERSKSFVKLYGTAKDKSTLIFDGSTKIYKGAKKCVVRQEGRIIDFDKEVKSSVSPILQIDENDIVASHGAVLGQIPTSTLFYLMSRGLSASEAQKLLSRGYFIPLRKEITSDVVGEIVDNLLENI